ncbi:uncharacterized protein LY89DRAFT_702235 [Mollisia scopiformis]|uniref:Zn(2)-C6 fungal-type domain-containing protein n=1 Tax=Mollisia scopiformis TaxID=149040 RepID=A0A132B713_MOLSC|nr:uncharacterized protein LY89DRAFT_702235 [Mollisia scopiformis]KUJ07789.1 hypothetical protein LY89DRAFT_702235 [Mollisia scopiformis]
MQMSSPEDHEKQSQEFNNSRPRRSHRKSRNGCSECKRRKVKCDEAKPTCGRCHLALQKCNYLPAPSTDDRKNKLVLPSPPRSSSSSSTHRLSASEFLPPLFEVPSCSTPPLVISELCARFQTLSWPLSDTDLYHHYLLYTSRTLTHCQRDQGVFQIGMPTLALQHKTVFHSILALSATSICCNMISREPPPDPSAVSHILVTANEHYNMASEQMRELMSQPQISKPEPLLASTILLVPFAAASQQIHHWIWSKSGIKKSNKLLASTPRDIIVIMRGVRTMLQTLSYGNESPSIKMTQETDLETDSLWLTEIGTPLHASPLRSRTHVMFPIIAASIGEAFSKLQERLALSTTMVHGDLCDLTACYSACEVLKTIGNTTFSPFKASRSASLSNIIEDSAQLKLKEASLPQVAPWLRSYAIRHGIPEPNEPLTRYFLTFLVQVPQTYLDLVLPLLDQRLESPSEDCPPLTMEQALALDIYAHWSILMFLVEDESWWIGNLPVVTMTGMLNRFGDDFVARAWPEYGREQWWPGRMFNVLREIKRRR